MQKDSERVELFYIFSTFLIPAVIAYQLIGIAGGYAWSGWLAALAGILLAAVIWVVWVVLVTLIGMLVFGGFQGVIELSTHPVPAGIASSLIIAAAVVAFICFRSDLPVFGWLIVTVTTVTAGPIGRIYVHEKAWD